MKTFLKWAGLTAAVVTGAAFAAQWASKLSRRMDEGLSHAERVASDAREAMEKGADALEHTEEAVRAARRTVS